MELEQWTTLNRQADLLETEILQQDATGITKIILRKSQRQLDAYTQWACFARDFYMCRYCGRQNTKEHPLPLSVDHIIVWEENGASIIDNLLTVCKSCNRDRGRVAYEIWINSDIYKQKSKNLSLEQKQANIDKIKELPYLRSLNVKHVRSR